MRAKTFNTLEINRDEGIIKIDGEQIPENATELNLRISGSECRFEIILGYSGSPRSWGRKSGRTKNEKITLDPSEL